MNVVTHISEKFFAGSLAALARFADVGDSTVWRWKDLNSIKHDHQRRILDRSDREGLGITADDFFPDRGATAKTKSQTAPAQ